MRSKRDVRSERRDVEKSCSVTSVEDRSRIKHRILVILTQHSRDSSRPNVPSPKLVGMSPPAAAAAAAWRTYCGVLRKGAWEAALLGRLVMGPPAPPRVDAIAPACCRCRFSNHNSRGFLSISFHVYELESIII